MKNLNPSLFAQNPEAPPIEWYIHRGVQTPGIISFAAGLVDPSAFPALEVQQASQKVLSTFASLALQYNSTQGHLPLREQIGTLLNHSDHSLSQTLKAEQLLITNGSQQALDLIARALLKPNDIVLLESPSYYVFVHALKSFNIRAIHLKTDSEGIIPEDLICALDQIEHQKQSDCLKFLYTIPYAHNPLGMTTTTARKQKIAQIWSTHRASQKKYLLEDAAYRELIWDENTPLSYHALGLPLEQWVYLGSFSKAFAPGFKIGYALIEPHLLEVCLRIKANEDFGSSSFNQYVLSELIENQVFQNQIKTWQTIYKQKAELMNEALKKHLPTWVHWKKSTGGLYFWIHTPGIDTGKNSELFKEAISNKVLYIPAELGFLNEEQVSVQGLRLAYGFVNSELIEEGVKRLGEILSKAKPQ